MDLLSTDTNPIMKKPEWPVYTADTLQPPMYMDERAELQQSLVSEGCRIEGRVENSVLFYGVKIGKGAVIKDSVILPNTVIEGNAIVNRAVVGSDSLIASGVKVGTEQNFGDITLIGDNQRIEKENQKVNIG